MDDKCIMLNVDKDNMKQKNYDLKVLAIANFQGYVDTERNCRVIDKKEFLANMKNVLKMTKHKCGIVTEALVELDIIREEGSNYCLNPVTAPFLKLYAPTVKYLINNLSPFNFKLYCYLLNKYNINKAYNLMDNYFFSKKELLEVCGYSRAQKNLLMLEQGLNTLEELALISYNHNSVGRPGKHGTYHELYWVSDAANAQITAAKETAGYLKGKTVDQEVAEQLRVLSDLGLLEEKNV